MSTAVSDDAFEAILGLAASAPSSSRAGPPPPRGSEERVAIWDEQRGIKIEGEEAPTAGELLTFLAAHRQCRVWRGEAGRGKASSSSSASANLPTVAYPSGSKPTLVASYCGDPSSNAKRARRSAEEGAEAKRTRAVSSPPTLPTGFIRQTEAAQKTAWDNGGATNVLLAMEAHPADAQLQADACQALTFLASHSPEYKQRVCEAGGALAIVRALEAHGSVAAVALQGCGALAVLTMETTARAAVREAGGAGALLRTMRLHSDTSRLQQLGCTAIASLAEMHVLPVEPLATAALAAMRAFPAEATLQAQGCRTLLHLATTPSRKRAVCDAGGAVAVVLAMLAHGGEAQVQQWGCGALSALADGDQHCHSAVCNAARHTGRSGSGSSAGSAGAGGGAGGGVHAILQAMAMHPAHVQVAQLGCAALAMLLLGEGGASVAQRAAAAREVVAYGGAALAVRAMGRHKQLPVQLQGCAMLALLAELGAKGVDGAAAARAAAAAPAALEALRVHACSRDTVRWASRLLHALPHPHVSAAAAAAAAQRVRTQRLSRAMLGSWQLDAHGAGGAAPAEGAGEAEGAGAGADGKFRLPLDLVSKIASLACTAERASETPLASGSGGPEGDDGL